MKRVTVALVFLFLLTFTMTVSAGTVMDNIQKTGVLRVGTTAGQAPMTAMTKSGEIIGLDADIAKAMAASMGVKVEFVVLPFKELISSLEAGKVDMILSGMTITPKRNQRVAYVGPYFVSGKGTLSLKERYAEIKQAEGLNSPEISIAATKGSTSQDFVTHAISKAKYTPIATPEAGVDLLLSGKVDVVVADFPFCALTAYRYQDKNLRAGKALTFEPLGIALPEDTLLINWVQNFMNTLQGTGVLPKLHKKWLNGGSWVDDLK